MNKVLDIIADETNGKCYTSFRYCADDEIRVPTLDFDTKIKEISVVVKEFGETPKVITSYLNSFRNQETSYDLRGHQNREGNKKIFITIVI